MTYQETTEYLFNQIPAFERQGASGYKEGLSNTLALDEHFGHPHRTYKTIHIGGTNGKGSCSHTLASILQEYGFKVGLYTSPHIEDFRERIRINGECINEDYVVDFVEKEKSFFEPLCPSFFEITTTMALKYFADNDVEIAIIEVGLGGRLDCTNIITPILSIITNISIDHTQFLGNSIESIAKEKAGIIKERVPSIIGESVAATRAVFENAAALLDSPITFAEDDKEVISATPNKSCGMTYKTKSFGEFDGDLGGIYQEKNTNTILWAYKTLVNKGHIGYNANLLKRGFANVGRQTGLVGRWQKLSDKPLLICDTGHNSGGWEYLAKQIEATPCTKKHIIFGMVADKDIDCVLSLLPKDATYYLTQPDTKRAMPVTTLSTIAQNHNLTHLVFEDINEAYQQARLNAHNNDLIFVGGSNYLVSDFLKIFRKTNNSPK